ncbi:MAG: tRNA (adenosine(37)-N6)-threonylcarbamoyltransferase complex ATPase subunit type 1 TsaE [Nitrospirae bacterium]|nr:tRNA (adenosine(37)-N6)-threonylcarbamoyltransferase complex ATPase subunit type 1 TsaE [Nitrospirota bacterium]
MQEVDTRSGYVCTVVTVSPEETRRLGEIIGGLMTGGELVAINGELGSGKTVFVKGLACGLGIKDKDVSSPTFIFVREYRGRLTLYHADLYRINRASDIEDLGLFDFIGGEGIMAVEWADRAGDLLPDNRIDIELIYLGNDNRKIALRGSTGVHEKILRDGIAMFLSGCRDDE